MPVTVRYSAALDRTYEECDLLQPPSSPTDSSRASGASTPRTDPASSSVTQEEVDLGFHGRTNSVDSLDDSLSSGGHSRQISSDSTEFIPTRTIKTNAKPAFNPLQFVKTGKSRLVKTAEQQIKQFEEVKKVKERVREDEEAWQSNLDNWKSKRRQISHKTIQKAEEIKQIEEVELDRQRKKSKTFNEMMEERTRRGTSSSLPVYDEWGGERVEDNEENPSAGCDVSFDSSGSDHVFHEDEGLAGDSFEQNSKPSAPTNASSNGNGRTETLGNFHAPKQSNGHSSDRSATSDEPEYTFDKAIRSYAQFAESHLKHSQPTDDGHRADRTWNSTDTCGPTASTPEKTTPEKIQTEDVLRIEERASGQQLGIVVCLRRGGESKDFGFTIKSVRGIGTGIFVETVHPQSPAHVAGLRENDEILAINGELCTSKRTHSAIVFAVKQAVYTGNLELDVYRYENTDPIRLGKPLASSSPTKSRRRSPDENLRESSSETVLDVSPKVDVVKRRFMFEAAARQSPERLQNRRSLDVSVKFKDKLASFENPETGRSQKRDSAAFKEKLESFRSLDSLDASPRNSPERSGLSAFDPQVRQKAERDSGEFERLQAFERTRSCERLDYDGRDVGEVAAPPADVASDDRRGKDFASPEPLISFDDDYDLKPESSAGIESEGRQDFGGVEGGPATSFSEQLLDLSNVSVDAGGRDTAVHERIFIPKSGFELAESLEETPITGSVPSSPCDGKMTPPAELRFNEVGAAGDEEIPLVDLDAVLDSQLENLDLGREVLLVEHVEAPLKTLEPPKEKPPPPPVEPENGKKNPSDKLLRADSTKRIKTEIWKRRSDFLGIDGEDVQNYIQNEIERVSPPPSHPESSPGDDPGRHSVVLDPEAGCGGVESEEEIARKEREIIENLEWEESQKLEATGKSDSGHGRQTTDVPAPVEAKAVEERRPESVREVPPVIPEIDVTLKKREEELQRQEELLRLEKEKLRLEQEELLRQKEAYQKRIEDHQRGNAVVDIPVATKQPQPPVATPPKKEPVRPSPIYETVQSSAPISPPDVRAHRTGPPLPSKPKAPASLSDAKPPEAVNNNNDDEWPVNARISPDQGRPSPVALQPLTKQALYALSASPKVKLMDADQWMAARRKANGQRRDDYNQHWLVQEAEFRRLHPGRQEEDKQQVYVGGGGGDGKWSHPQQHQQQAPPLPPNNQRKAPPPSTNGAIYAVPDSSRANRQAQRLVTTPEKAGPLLYAPPPPHERRQDGPGEVKVRAPPPHLPKPGHLGPKPNLPISDRENNSTSTSQMLSVSGKKKCSHCAEELGRGAAMIIESLQLFYHINCFKCCVCHIQLGNGTSGADVRVRSQKLHCHNCYSNDEGLKFSKV